ncbi:MAG: class I tRNA ligase family protein, partial [Terriglobales bacterium]
YRAFANKIWNAGRFILMNLEKLPEPMRENLGRALAPIPGVGFEPVANIEALELADRWMFSRLAAVTRQINDALANYRFHEAAYTIYHFFWHEFCDWYVEWVKPAITLGADGGITKLSPRSESGAGVAAAVGVTSAPPPAWVNLSRAFEASLRLLQPFMPFITEELWHQLPGRRDDDSLSLSAFALAGDRSADPVSEKQFETMQELIVAARNAKAEMGLQNVRPSAQVASEDLRVLELFRTHQETIHRLAGLQAMNFTRGRLAADAGGVRATPGFDVRLFHEAPADHEAERARLQKEKEKLEKALAQAQKQLENQEFMSRAPREVVRGVEKRCTELAAQQRRLLESLERLG